jgi:hypothetical protein
MNKSKEVYEPIFKKCEKGLSVQVYNSQEGAFIGAYESNDGMSHLLVPSCRISEYFKVFATKIPDALNALETRTVTKCFETEVCYVGKECKLYND